jgi:hypothetical protein
MPKYAFKFIAGKYQDGEYPIPEAGELIIGRAADVEIVLVEDMVSRRHAKLVVHNNNMTLSDLGSTNGTYVNGEKITTLVVHLDDRVMVGTSIFKIIPLETAESQIPVDPAQLRANLMELGDRGQATSRSMSGDLAEVPLPDLLQLFATNKRTGTLKVEYTESRYGTVALYIKAGALEHLQADALPTLPPQKVLCRLMTLTNGKFEFVGNELPPQLPKTFENTLENLLIEATRLNDETRRALQSMPACGQGFFLTRPLQSPLSALKPEQLATLQQAINLGDVDEVLDATALSDEAAVQHLTHLLKERYLTAKT